MAWIRTVPLAEADEKLRKAIAGEQASQGLKSLAQDPPDLHMELRLESASNRFQVGELLPIEVLLSSSTPNHYLEPCELFSERTFGYPLCRFFSRWNFSVTPAEGRTEPG